VTSGPRGSRRINQGNLHHRAPRRNEGEVRPVGEQGGQPRAVQTRSEISHPGSNRSRGHRAATIGSRHPRPPAPRANRSRNSRRVGMGCQPAAPRRSRAIVSGPVAVNRPPEEGNRLPPGHVRKAGHRSVRRNLGRERLPVRRADQRSRGQDPRPASQRAHRSSDRPEARPRESGDRDDRHPRQQRRARGVSNALLVMARHDLPRIEAIARFRCHRLHRAASCA